MTTALLWLTPLLQLVSAGTVAGEAASCGQGALPASHPKVPCVVVPSCATGTAAKISPYAMSNGSGPAFQLTVAEVCHTAVGFQIKCMCPRVPALSAVPAVLMADAACCRCGPLTTTCCWLIQIRQLTTT